METALLSFHSDYRSIPPNTCDNSVINVQSADTVINMATSNERTTFMTLIYQTTDTVIHN